jgi:hypothetical protein
MELHLVSTKQGATLLASRFRPLALAIFKMSWAAYALLRS